MSKGGGGIPHSALDRINRVQQTRPESEIPEYRRVEPRETAVPVPEPVHTPAHVTAHIPVPDGSLPTAAEPMIRFHAYLRPSQREWLEALATERGVKAAEILRHVLDWYVEHGPLSHV